MVEQVYKASLDKLAKGVTIGITILFVCIIAGQFYLTQRVHNNAIPAIVSLTLASIYLIAFLFRPLRYRLTPDELIICRPINNIKIKRANIAAVIFLDGNKLSGAIRTFGVGGLFGYYGKFTNSAIGNMTWYVTQRKNAVLIKTTDSTNIILSPDEAEDFVVSFNQ